MIISTSNGYSTGKQSSFLKTTIKQLCSNKKILLITNGATKEYPSHKKINYIKKHFYKLNCPIVDSVVLTQNNLSYIFNYDVLYIMGGSLYELLNLANNTHFKSWLIPFLSENKILISEAEASVVLHKNIEWYYNLVGEQKSSTNNLNGLNVSRYKILPSYDLLPQTILNKISNYELENDTTIIKLKEGSCFIELYNQKKLTR